LDMPGTSVWENRRLCPMKHPDYMVRLGLTAVSTILLAVYFCAAITACSEKDDTEAIRTLIQKGAGLAEEKKLGDLMDLTTPEFMALPGHYDARMTKRTLLGAFLHYGKFKIHFPRPAVEFDEGKNSAMATVHFLIVRQNQGIPGLKELYNDPRRWLEKAGEKADLYQLKLVLVKNGGDWQVREAALEGFKGTGF